MKGVLAQLAQLWRNEHATLLRRYGDERGAQICEYHAAQLEVTLHEHESELLSIAEASAVSGYSRSYLYHAVGDGTCLEQHVDHSIAAVVGCRS